MAGVIALTEVAGGAACTGSTADGGGVTGGAAGSMRVVKRSIRDERSSSSRRAVNRGSGSLSCDGAACGGRLTRLATSWRESMAGGRSGFALTGICLPAGGGRTSSRCGVRTSGRGTSGWMERAGSKSTVCAGIAGALGALRCSANGAAGSKVSTSLVVAGAAETGCGGRSRWGSGGGTSCRAALPAPVRERRYRSSWHYAATPWLRSNSTYRMRRFCGSARIVSSDHL